MCSKRKVCALLDPFFNIIIGVCKLHLGHQAKQGRAYVSAGTAKEEKRGWFTLQKWFSIKKSQIKAGVHLKKKSN